MSVNNVISDAGAVTAYGSHKLLAQEDVHIFAEYDPAERGDFYLPAFPASCEITALAIFIRDDIETAISLTDVGFEVIRDWEEDIIKALEDTE